MAKVRMAAAFTAVMVVALVVGQYQPVAAGQEEISAYKY